MRGQACPSMGVVCMYVLLQSWMGDLVLFVDLDLRDGCLSASHFLCVWKRLGVQRTWMCLLSVAAGVSRGNPSERRSYEARQDSYHNLIESLCPLPPWSV